MRSRRDLKRVHRMMGTRAIVARALRKLGASCDVSQPLRILELGAGDGSLMLGLARAFGTKWPAVELTLLDRQQLVSTATVAHYAAAGWRAMPLVSDVFDWAAAPAAPDRTAAGAWDIIICNLFLHHFEGAQLQALLAAIAERTGRFFACEPHRARLALAGSHLVGLIGANAVTREDAVLSVRAGFRGTELSQLWTTAAAAAAPDWTLEERPAGLFSHCLTALRRRPHASGAG